jgi:flagellar basal body-associated protein FliL
VSTQEVLVDEEEEATGGRSRKLLVVIAVVFLGLAGGGWWFLGPASAEEAPADVDGEIVALPALTTTLGQASLHHARVSLAVVLVEGADAEVITLRTALLQDRLLQEVATMNADQVRSPDGSEQLRTRLSAAAKEIWGEEVVRRVVLTELLVQ